MISRQCGARAGVLGHIQRVLSRSNTTSHSAVSAHGGTLSTSCHEVRYSDGFCVREAGAGDTDGILALSRAALGRDYTTDYLPGWLPRALTDPNRVLCVAEKDGVISGFVMGICGIDGGRTLLAEAGRVLPTCSGLGLVGRTLYYLVAQCARRCESYQRLRSSSLLVDFFDKNHDKINLLAKRVYAEVHIPAQSLTHLNELNTTQWVATHKLTDEEFGTVLADADTSRTLYPQGLIAAGFHVFDAHPSNVHHITYFHNNVFLSRDIRAISTGGLFPCSDGRAWRYNFNYSGVVDLSTCQAHLAAHLRHIALGLGHKDVFVFVSLAKSFKNLFGQETIIYTLRELLSAKTEDITLRMQYQYEFV